MVTRRRNRRSNGGVIVPVLAVMTMSLVPLCRGERVYDEVVFDSKTCQDLDQNNKLNSKSYAQYFDVCAIMEFCEDPTAELPQRNDRRRHRQRRLNHNEKYPPSPQLTSDAEIYFEEEADLAEHHHDYDDDDHNKKNEKHYNARFGWKLIGAKECLWPGPIMRLERGLKHGLFVKGSGGNTTNLHFHGLHAAGHGNGDDILRELRGGDTLIYEIHLPADRHMGGTHWYHSHLYHEAWDQVLGGAYGMMIIHDGDHDVGTTDAGVLKFLANERIMILDDTHGQWVANGNRNGLEEYRVHRDEWYRLRILMVSADGHSSGAHVRFESGCEVRSVAHDGILRTTVPKDIAEDRFPMTSSSRLDAAIRCTKNAKVTIYGRHVAEFKIREDDRRLSSDDHDHDNNHIVPSPYENGRDSWQSLRLPYLMDLRNVPVDNTWRIDVKGKSLNGLVYNASKPLCNVDGSDFRYGSVQEWTLKNTVKHPLHVHMYPMQVVTDYCGDGHDNGEFYDTIVSDTSRRNRQYPCLVRTRLIDVAGPVLLHCHILFHAERGAQGWFHVVTGNDETDDIPDEIPQPDFPRVHECEEGTPTTTDACDPPRVFPKCTDFNA
eukprot:CAMPEP_0116543892 /NCGR_PEP_ID=MMETSP0397-20121206/1815_1 /TAXON_ID=216820 /ORGANISM="Cyclophora tenuis, Strain ECT3854" /LENGTH=602 /DNA_ID=CAMNT_0004068045 /DNA_START=108 /DNA_END=1916 /DNA_ORIENTATION=-